MIAMPFVQNKERGPIWKHPVSQAQNCAKLSLSGIGGKKCKMLHRPDKIYTKREE
jgi:hypothetical protein